MSETIETPLSAHEDLHLARHWLDALASGACDTAAFIRAVPELTYRSPDAGWDLLSLLDQYFRLGKISEERFRAVKSLLEQALLGAGLEIDVSVPIPGREPAPPSPAPATATPAAATPANAATPPATPAAATPTPAAATPTPAAATPAPASPARASPAPVAPQAAAPGPETLPTRPAATEPAPAVSAPPATPTLTCAIPGRQPTAPLHVAALVAAEQADAVTQPQEFADLPKARSSPPPLRAPATEVAADPKPGELLRGRYRLQRVIGRGGMGTVFEAIDEFRLDLPNAERRLAIKVLSAGARERPERLAELRREFQNLQSLAHPNIVRAFEYDRDGELSFFTMEYLSGVSLSRLLAARQEVPLAREHALAILRDAGGALAYAHGRGLVHGDLNPANVFITDQGEVRLLDFGGTRLGSNGVATPRYASAQVLEGEPADARDDLYSLACIAYLLLTGHHAYGERTAIEARTHRARPRRPADLSSAAWLALREGLALERERRPADLADWLKSFDFRAAANRLPVLIDLLRLPSRAPRRAASSILLIVLVLGLGAAAAWAILDPELAELVAGRIERQVSLGANLLKGWTESLQERLRSAVSAGNLSPEAPRPPAPTAIPSAPSAVQGPASAATEPAATAGGSPGAPRPAVPAAVPTPAGSASPAARAPTETSISAAGKPAHIEFAASTIDVPPSETAALVLVRRTGNVHGDASFSWWTESGTAKPGEDFSPVAPHVEHFDDGESAIRLSVPLAAGAGRRQPRSFYVVLSDPSAGAVLGERSLAMVTLPASEASGAGT